MMTTLPRPAGEADIIEELVLRAFGLDRRGISTFRTASRGKADIAFARQVAIYMANTYLGLTLTAAGRMFDRDRTTAAHACRVVEDRRDDPIINNQLETVERALTGWMVFVGNSVRRQDILLESLKWRSDMLDLVRLGKYGGKDAKYHARLK
jgi:hypothetical protein